MPYKRKYSAHINAYNNRQFIKCSCGENVFYDVYFIIGTTTYDGKIATGFQYCGTKSDCEKVIKDYKDNSSDGFLCIKHISEVVW